MDCFIEGPSFDKSGDLYVVDIPFGRIFRISRDGIWSLIIEYDGWPIGLKIAPDGRGLVADYMNGLMELDSQRDTISPLLGQPQLRVLQRLQRPAYRD
ncbi:sugar lactone lactonase YvrE [Bradyrhizobium sp. GM6.1]